MVKKKQRTLNPEFQEIGLEEEKEETQEEINNNKIKNLFSRLEQKPNTKPIMDDIKQIIETNPEEVSSADTFFKNALDKLYSLKDISLKTEYTDKEDTFAGSKLAFLTKECGFESAKDFLPIWEVKSVSKGREGRREIVLMMREREQERRAQEEKDREKYRKEINM